MGVVDPQVLVIRFLMKDQQVVGTGDGAVHDARAHAEMLVERKPIGDKLARLPTCSVFSDVNHHVLVPCKPCGVIDFHQLLGNGGAPRIVDRLKRYVRHARIRLVKPFDDLLDNPAFRVRKSLPIAVFQKRDLAFLPLVLLLNENAVGLRTFTWGNATHSWAIEVDHVPRELAFLPVIEYQTGSICPGERSHVHLQQRFRRHLELQPDNVQIAPALRFLNPIPACFEAIEMPSDVLQGRTALAVARKKRIKQQLHQNMLRHIAAWHLFWKQVCCHVGRLQILVLDNAAVAFLEMIAEPPYRHKAFWGKDIERIVPALTENREDIRGAKRLENARRPRKTAFALFRHLEHVIPRVKLLVRQGNTQLVSQQRHRKTSL